jgi:hypothetical protein
VQPNGSGKVFTGDASAILAVARVPKVSVAVYMNQASPAAPRECEADSEEDAAISADHQRSVSRFDNSRQTIGKAMGVLGHRSLVANMASRTSGVVIDVPTWKDYASINRPHLCEPPE